MAATDTAVAARHAHAVDRRATDASTTITDDMF
jgi:hypothetical protein